MLIMEAISDEAITQLYSYSTQSSLEIRYTPNILSKKLSSTKLLKSCRFFCLLDFYKISALSL